MIRRFQRELSVAVAFVGLLVVLAIAAPDFFQAQNLKAKLVDNANVLVLACGMTLVILARQIDISVGSQFGICGVVAGLLVQHGLPMGVAALVAIGLGALLGLVNGLLVAGMRLPSIVVTLATMVIWREGLRWVREGEFVRNLPPGFQWFGANQAIGQWIVVAIAVIVFVVMAWSMSNLAVCRAVYAVGSDQEAARLSGIRPPRVICGVFVLMGALTGLAALLSAVRFVDIDPNSGQGLDLQVIAAVVVGGVAVSGGRGTLVGTSLGVLLLGSIGSALVFLKIPTQWDKALQGLIILAAVASDAWRRKK